GVREVGHDGTFLGIEGADGRTTLSVANLAVREDLVAKIGTPEGRGSRRLACNADAFGAWETMASYARDIEQQDYPYIAYALPGSPTPTINSSSAIASLIYYSGLDASRSLPFGVHMSPGTTTLLGTGSDDVLSIDSRFSSLLGGRGNDEFFGGSDRKSDRQALRRGRRRSVPLVSRFQHRARRPAWALLCARRFRRDGLF